jgi:hypothetical protein
MNSIKSIVTSLLSSVGFSQTVIEIPRRFVHDRKQGLEWSVVTVIDVDQGTAFVYGISLLSNGQEAVVVMVGGVALLVRVPQIMVLNV